MKTVIIIGGGPAGMTAALAAAQTGKKAVLLERNEKLGKKLYITGKGRCNLTNNSDVENHIKNIISNPSFMYSALYTFTPYDTMRLAEELGVPLKTERGNRVFPVSDKSSDIIKAFEKGLKNAGVKCVLNCRVRELKSDKGRLTEAVTSRGSFSADSFIIATGGLSYPSTGSTGDGYKFAQDSGHSIKICRPSLVGLKTKEELSGLSGLTLKNIAIKADVGGKTVYKDFGELMFTHSGISGPVVLSASRYITDEIEKEPVIYIDLKPALDRKTLDKRILRDFEEFKNLAFKNSLNKLMPKGLAPYVAEKSGIDGSKPVNSITKEERMRLEDVIKGFDVHIKSTEGFGQAVITKGGVDVTEIDPSTMRSRLAENLYFAGEIIDTDALTGGYNLQIAFSTGYLAGINA